MNLIIILAQGDDGSLWLRQPGTAVAHKVCTVEEASRVLERSTRQIYRNIKQGLLDVKAKVLNKWLIDSRSIERLRISPSAAQPIPIRLQRLFPEYLVSELNVGRNSKLIFSRILEMGSLDDLRWLFARCSEKSIQQFVENDAARTLSPRQCRLWSLFFGVRIKRTSWRNKKNPWAKVS